MTDLGQEEVLDALDDASGAALVREVPDVPGRYIFSHALTQHTLYQGLPTVRRTRAHRQVAEAIEATVGKTPDRRVGELAHHWLSASQPANAAKAIGYALGRRARPPWPPWPPTMRSGTSPGRSTSRKWCLRTTPWSAVTCVWPWARHNARPGCRAFARHFSTPHTEPKSLPQRQVVWWPPH